MYGTTSDLIGVLLLALALGAFGGAVMIAAINYALRHLGSRRDGGILDQEYGQRTKR